MGVDRHAVKRSAGRLGFMGSCSLGPQDASWMQFLAEGGRGACDLDRVCEFMDAS